MRYCCRRGTRDLLGILVEETNELFHQANVEDPDMTKPEELVILMTLPLGVDESVIPGVLASSGIPVYVSERYLAHQGRYVEIKVPASRLEDAQRALDDAKQVGEQIKPGNDT